MATDLGNVNWPIEAKNGGFCVKALAGKLGHPIGVVRQHFEAVHGECPTNVFPRWRLALIIKLLRAGDEAPMSGEEIAKEAGFANRAALSRFIARVAGCTLAELRARVKAPTSHKDDKNNSRTRPYSADYTIPPTTMKNSIT